MLSTRASANPLVEGTLASQVQIVHLEEEAWVAVAKPPGMLVHRTKLYHAKPGEVYVVDAVASAVSQLLGRETSVLPVQRLDRCTSGVMVFALDSSANAASLQSALQAEDAKKQYFALSFGCDMPLKWTNDNPLKDLTGKVRKQRAARTDFEQLLRLEEADLSVLRAELRSGRRHQIRRHLSNSRHPILGDTSYAKGVQNRRVREEYGVERCCLHARRLEFTDPASSKRHVLHAAVPVDIRTVLQRVPGYNEAEHNQLLDMGDM